MTRLMRDRSGQGLIEYGLGLAALVLVVVVSLSALGVKQVDVLGMTMRTMPGSHPSDYHSGGELVVGGELVELGSAGGLVGIDINSINANQGAPRIGTNLGEPAAADLIVEKRVD